MVSTNRRIGCARCAGQRQAFNGRQPAAADLPLRGRRGCRTR
jgi:hypothetical protein